MCGVFCPMCNAHLVAIQCPMTTITRHPVYGPSIMIKLGYGIVCTGCSLVSELSESGVLIDLGNITVQDLDAPFVPGLFEPRVFMQAGSSLLWRRRDS
jgi:hypothetical protein